MAERTGKRPLGRPRTRWKDSVVKDLRVLQEAALLDIGKNGISLRWQLWASLVP